jgi:hypothetical protein
LLVAVRVRVENDFHYPHYSSRRTRKKKLGKPQFMVQAMCKSWRDAGDVQILVRRLGFQIRVIRFLASLLQIP